MKHLRIFAIILILAGCASKEKVEVDPNLLVTPQAATSHDDLIEQLPPGQFAGDIDSDTAKDGKPFELLFIKKPLEKVPSLVALYLKNGENRKLIYSAPSPFRKNACDHNECVFKFASYPYPVGFEISMVAVIGPQMRQDFLFKWENGDFRLVRRAVLWPQMVSDNHGVMHTKCSQADNLQKGQRYEVAYPFQRKTALQADKTQAQYLRQDAIKFANANEPNACTALGETPGAGFKVIQ